MKVLDDGITEKTEFVDTKTLVLECAVAAGDQLCCEPDGKFFEITVTNAMGNSISIALLQSDALKLGAFIVEKQFKSGLSPNEIS
jgi:hypothetical protein